MFFLEL